ncbi:hypothetical protein NMG60_11004643 [Bertholletia excelsa]
MPRRRQRHRQRPGERVQEVVGETSVIDLLGEDLLQNILSRLPALTFASAACVSRSWNVICSRVLSGPKLSSAISLNHSPQVAVKEVVDKVLSEPIRPHFAMACASPTFDLRLIHQLIAEKLGSTTPVVTYQSKGIVGRNALSGEFKEVQWDITVQDDLGAQGSDIFPTVTHGILLIVGYLPGLKVDAVPLLRSAEDHQVPLIDKFVMDIQEYTSSFSDSKSPAGIIMFAGPAIDAKRVLDKLDYSMSMETAIVGDASVNFLHQGQAESGNNRSRSCNSFGVALVFVRDQNIHHGSGEIEFHIMSSAGLSPIGPTFKAASVKERYGECSTWLTARREGLHDILDGQTMLSEIDEEIGNRIEYPVLYIGVTKRRKCSVGLEKVRWMTSLAFHEVTGGDEEYLFVYGGGIKTGDSFRFYHSDPVAALSCCSKVSEHLKRLKQESQDWACHKSEITAARTNKGEVFGGIIFACCGRGESFFDRPNVDSSPFLENFPAVPFGGTFCCGEIGRATSSLYDREAREPSAVHSSLHYFSTVYLVLSYTPPSERRN